MMKSVHTALALAMTFLACACMRPGAAADADRVTGDTPGEVSSSIRRVSAELDSDKQVQFSEAITSLTLAMSDRNDSHSVGLMSPRFAQTISGRNADQIIQLAALYRSSAPMDRP
jgi:hypothetical protein